MHLPEVGYTVRADDAKGNNATCKKLKRILNRVGPTLRKSKYFVGAFTSSLTTGCCGHPISSSRIKILVHRDDAFQI